MIRKNTRTGRFGSAVLILSGIFAAAYAVARPVFNQPFILLNYRQHLGDLDGDKNHTLNFGLLNYRGQHLAIQVRPPGCMRGGTESAELRSDRLGTVWFEYPFDIRHSPVGPGTHTIVIEGKLNGEPFRQQYVVDYTIKRVRL